MSQDLKAVIKPEVKSIFLKAYVVALDKVEKSQKLYNEILRSPKNSTGEKFYEAIVDLALSKAKLEQVLETYKTEGGKGFPEIY